MSCMACELGFPGMRKLPLAGLPKAVGMFVFLTMQVLQKQNLCFATFLPITDMPISQAVTAPCIYLLFISKDIDLFFEQFNSPEGFEAGHSIHENEAIGDREVVLWQLYALLQTPGVIKP